ncbi:endonuclease domain-containing protein [Geodermatophilus sp. SYSU D00705]
MADHDLPPTYTRTQAREAGMTRAQLRDDGVRVSRGAYVSRSVRLSVYTASTAVLPLLPAGTAVSHRTAAALLGAPVPADWPLEVVVPVGSYRPRRRRLRVHVRDLAPGDVIRHLGLPVTSGPQTWLDLAAVLPPDRLVAAGDALYRAGHLDDGSLRQRLERADGVRGVVRAREWAPFLSPLAMSPPESLVRCWFIEAGLPHPLPQVEIEDHFGRVVAHADLGWPEWKVAVEYEGRQHAEPGRFGSDIDRYSLMAADGWLVVRFGALHLRQRDVVVDRAARALRSRGARW